MKTQVKRIIILGVFVMAVCTLGLSAQINNKSSVTDKDTVRQDRTSVRNEKAIPADTYLGKDLDSSKSKKQKNKNKDVKEKSDMYLVPDSTKKKNK